MKEISEAVDNSKSTSGKARFEVSDLLNRSLEVSLSLDEDYSQLILGAPNLTATLTVLPKKLAETERSPHILVQFKEELESLYKKPYEELSFSEKLTRTKTDPVILGLLDVSTSTAPSTARIKFPKSEVLKRIVESRETAKEIPALPLEMLLVAIEKDISVTDLLVDAFAFNLFTLKKEKIKERGLIFGENRDLVEISLHSFETSKQIFRFKNSLDSFLSKYSRGRDMGKGRLKAAEDLISYTEDFINLTYASRMEMNRSLLGEPGNLFMSFVFIESVKKAIEKSISLNFPYNNTKTLSLGKVAEAGNHHSFLNIINNEIKLIELGYTVTNLLYEMKREIDREGMNFLADTKGLYKIQEDITRYTDLIRVAPIKPLLVSQSIS